MSQRAHLFSTTNSLRLAGGVVLIAGVLYMFLGIAIVCDEFFVASLEAISEALNLLKRM
jgi:hypothetical protein